jgi:HK97 family phage major capsid protein
MTIGNQPIFIAPGALPLAPSGTLLGRPIFELEMAGGLGTLGDITLLDLNQYRVIEKGGIDSASSIHVRFQNDETTFRFVMRNNGLPIWTNTTTPNQAAGTAQSPYVALAANV